MADSSASGFSDVRASEPRRMGGWISGIIWLLVVIGVGAAVRYGTGAFVSQSLPAAQLALTSDEQLVARLEREMLEDSRGRFFVRMRDSYPEDYRQFLQGFIPIVRQNRDEEQVRQAAFSYAQSYMQDFIGRHRSAITSAEPQYIDAWVNAELRALDAVAAVSQQACAEIAEFGSVSAQTGMSTYPSVLAELESVTITIFDLIDSGRRAPQEYASLSDEEWALLGDAALLNGADPQALAVIGTAEFANQTATAKCSIGTGIYRAISLEPNPQLRARMAVAMLANS